MWGIFGYLTLEKKQVQKSVKHQIMEGIDKEELIYMAFSKNDIKTKLNWKHSKEFELNGEMYDIVERRETSDSAFYWVWWDKEETELNRRVRRLAAEIFGQNPDHQEKNQLVQQFYKSLFFENQWVSDNYQFNNSSDNEFFYLMKRTQTHKVVLSPPPKNLV